MDRAERLHRCLSFNFHTAAGAAQGMHSRLCISASTLQRIPGAVCFTCNVGVRRAAASEGLRKLTVQCTESSKNSSGQGVTRCQLLTASAATLLSSMFFYFLGQGDPQRNYTLATRTLVRDNPSHNWAAGQMLFIN